MQGSGTTRERRGGETWGRRVGEVASIEAPASTNTTRRARCTCTIPSLSRGGSAARASPRRRLQRTRCRHGRYDERRATWDMRLRARVVIFADEHARRDARGVLAGGVIASRASLARMRTPRKFPRTRARPSRIRTRCPGRWGHRQPRGVIRPCTPRTRSTPRARSRRSRAR